MGVGGVTTEKWSDSCERRVWTVQQQLYSMPLQIKIRRAPTQHNGRRCNRESTGVVCRVRMGEVGLALTENLGVLFNPLAQFSHQVKGSVPHHGVRLRGEGQNCAQHFRYHGVVVRSKNSHEKNNAMTSRQTL